MSACTRRVLLAWTALSLAVCAAPVPNLSGTWVLNIEKSRWGKKPKPQSVVVVIEHNEPALKYTGTVVDANGDSRHFTVEGLIDGKEYPVAGDHGEGTIVLRRLNATTTSHELRSNDGRFVETATSRLSLDGKVLTRRLRQRSPEATLSWTEVYEKR